MSKSNVIKYFSFLESNPEFKNTVIKTGKDKDAKMAIISEYGFVFSKEEFDEVMEEVVAEENKKSLCTHNEAVELMDEDYSDVAGGLAIGAALGALIGGCAAAYVKSKNYKDDGSGITKKQAVIESAIMGAGTGGLIGAFLPF